jgi:hypothetical protein
MPHESLFSSCCTTACLGAQRLLQRPLPRAGTSCKCSTCNRQQQQVCTCWKAAAMESQQKSPPRGGTSCKCSTCNQQQQRSTSCRALQSSNLQQLLHYCMQGCTEAAAEAAAQRCMLQGVPRDGVGRKPCSFPQWLRQVHSPHAALYLCMIPFSLSPSKHIYSLQSDHGGSGYPCASPSLLSTSTAVAATHGSGAPPLAGPNT